MKAKEPKWIPGCEDGWGKVVGPGAFVFRREWRAAMRWARVDALIEAAEYLERTGFDCVSQYVREMAARRGKT